MTYDILLVGATGQVGRYMLRELVRSKKSMAVTVRTKDMYVAREILKDLLEGESPPDSVHIVLGDGLECDLPNADRVMNVAGYTGLVDATSSYWDPNIRLNIRLARHAVRTGAEYHYISTVSVAMMGAQPLTETDRSVPHEDQIPYTLSKVVGESLAVATVDSSKLRIYRICDVVPDIGRMNQDWRRDHWLSVLFGCGRQSFDALPPDFKCYVAEGSDVARAVVKLMDSPVYPLAWHVLGWPYSAGWLKEKAIQRDREGVVRVGRKVAKILLKLDLEREIRSDFTNITLERHGFWYRYLGGDYWRMFSTMSYDRSFPHLGEIVSRR